MKSETVAGEAWSPAIPARYISSVIEKLADGRYPTERVRCFCGADFNDTVVAEKDRYFIPHRMVMCNECTLIRATPRMTAPAYEEFYNSEYRPIYDGWEFGENGQDDDFLFMIGAEGGISFKLFLDYFNIKPKTIIDIGCALGGSLLPFKEAGAKVYGVEIYEHGASYARRHGIPVFRNIDDAAKFKIKADVIVLQDVIEHYSDLSKVSEVCKLLAPDGILYIGTPGLFKRKLQVLFQNAHTYQFIAESLEYVMAKLGFEAMYLDETIDSLWVYKGEEATPRPKPKWQRYVIEHLQQKELRSLPPIRCINKFTVEERWKAMDECLSLGFPDLGALLKKYQGEIVIIGGGPSVDSELPNIKRLIANGAKSIVIERMYPWCSEVGITPDFVTALDACEDVVEGFVKIQPDTIHIINNSIQPKAAHLLKDYKTYIYAGNNPHMKVQSLWFNHGYDHVTQINTGGSVALAAFSIALSLGFRKIHIFGMDCKIQPDKAYADGIAGQSVRREYFPILLEDGKEIATCATFISFVRQFFGMASTAHQLGFVDSIDVHGDSLINDMWDKKTIQ